MILDKVPLLFSKPEYLREMNQRRHLLLWLDDCCLFFEYFLFFVCVFKQVIEDASVERLELGALPGLHQYDARSQHNRLENLLIWDGFHDIRVDDAP